MALDFSLSISCRARASMLACSVCACSTSSARTRSAATRASAMSFCASPRDASSAARCSASRLGGLLAVALRRGDRLLERLLARPHGGRDRTEGELAEDEGENDEDDQRPRHQPEVGREQICLWRFFLRERRRGDQHGESERTKQGTHRKIGVGEAVAPSPRGDGGTREC